MYIMNVLVTSGIIKPEYCAWYQVMNIFHESNCKFFIAEYSKLYGMGLKTLWQEI